MTQPANRARWLHVEMTRGRLQAPVASLNGTVVNNSASGEARPVEMPGNDFNDVGTLGWDAYVEVTLPAAQGADGASSAGAAFEGLVARRSKPWRRAAARDRPPVGFWPHRWQLA